MIVRVVILFLWVQVLGAQEIYVLKDSIETKAKSFTTDNLHNIYLSQDNFSIKKLNANGITPYQFSTKKYGALQFIDATNPLKLLVFYPSYSKIVALDNTLSESGVYDLQQLDMPQVSAIALSFDNNVWVYDDLSLRLKKINDNYEVIQQSEDLGIILGKTLSPNFMIERANYVYVNDPEQGIFIFDLYGTFYKTIAIKGLKEFQVFQNQIIYYQAGSIKKYNLRTLETVDVPAPRKDMLNIRVEHTQVFTLSNSYLYQYELRK